jgi:hypothetical protein
MVQYPMKYPASLLTSFLATLSQDVPLGSRRHPRVSILSTLLSACASIACALLKSLASLFATPFLYFQSVADSFCKKPGWVGAQVLLILAEKRAYLPSANYL